VSQALTERKAAAVAAQAQRDRCTNLVWVALVVLVSPTRSQAPQSHTLAAVVVDRVAALAVLAVLAVAARVA
jgi:hypothetical protein